MSQTTQSISMTSTQLQIPHKCIGNNSLSQFCLNSHCQIFDTNFVCNNQQCKCYQPHKYCMKGSVKTVLKTIRHKLNHYTTKLKTDINQIFSNLIQKITKLQKQFLKQVDQTLKFSQLIDLEKCFYDIFCEDKNQKFKELNSFKLYNLWLWIGKDNTENSKSQQLFKGYYEQIQIYQKQGIQQIQKTKKSIAQVLINFDNKKKSQLLKRQNNLKGKEFFINMPNEWSSTIIDNNFKIQQILFFFDKKVKKISQVFKASENNFEIVKYYQKCGNLQDTMIICQVNNNKIIGCFTPLSFNPIFQPQKQQKDHFISDQSNTSFIFSLSMNDKFPLLSKQNAIYRCATKQFISIGGDTFKIVDKSNQTNNSLTSLANKYYGNQKYTNNNESYVKLNGNQNQNMQLKEWEVYKVVFE